MDDKRYITDDLSDILTSELLKELPNYFTSFDDIEHTAYLNWRFDSIDGVEGKFSQMGRAYFDTVIVLIDDCIKNNNMHKADVWIFPILFHTVHAIEVYLKAFNSIYRRYLRLQDCELDSSRIEGKHDIKQLCQTAMKLLKDNGDKEILEEFKFVEKFINILYQHTSDMTFARYPISSSKENHFYVNKYDNITINLYVLRQWVLRVYMILGDANEFISENVDNMTEELMPMVQSNCE